MLRPLLLLLLLVLYVLPFDYSHTGTRGDCAVRTSLGLRLALRCALLARQAKKNAIGSPIALQLAFFRPTWLVRALSGRSQDAPGLDFQGRNDGFLDVCRLWYARFCTTS